jgi:DNA (cytosine-5)-methyltransferase 1
MRVLSLFSGIGGMDLGLERAGMTVVGQCEIDPYCRKVLAKHWPGAPCWDDVTTLTGEWIEQNCGGVDVIAGGFPCVDISNAGLRAGISAPRSGLYRELVRCLRVVRPRFAILENVAALLGRGMGTVLGDLAESGYDADWDCVSACELGAPHARERVFCVAHANEVRCTPRGNLVSYSPGFDTWKATEGKCQWRDMELWLRAFVENRYGNAADPRTAGMVDGIPFRVERCGSLGNAVVPQVAEVVGRAVMQAAKEPA